MIGQFGINMIVPIFLCSFAGYFLDKKLGTGFIVIIGFFIGAVTGGYNVYRMAKRIFSRESAVSAYEGSGSRDDAAYPGTEGSGSRDEDTGSAGTEGGAGEDDGED